MSTSSSLSTPPIDTAALTAWFLTNEQPISAIASIVFVVILALYQQPHSIWSFVLLAIIFFFAFQFSISIAFFFAALGSLIVGFASYDNLFQFSPRKAETMLSMMESFCDGDDCDKLPNTCDPADPTCIESFDGEEVENHPVDGSSIDVAKTLNTIVTSLTPQQIESMTTDTKELMETQKSLLKTVKELAPVITQGREMLETFKGYFGDAAAMGKV